MRLPAVAIAAVQPLVGIISAGVDNPYPYGHPSPGLLDRLEHAGLPNLRPDRDGAVQVLTDGTRLEITRFVACTGAASAASLMKGVEEPKHEQQNKEK